MFLLLFFKIDFKEYTFVEYKVINIEKPLNEQGISNQSIDIIIGFDVVHT